MDKLDEANITEDDDPLEEMRNVMKDKKLDRITLWTLKWILEY